MKTALLRAFLICTFLVVSFSTIVAAKHTASPTETALQNAATLTCAERSLGADCRLLSITKEELKKNLVHYKAYFKVGSGEFDVIAVHRVVREPREGSPVPTVGAYLFVHGSAANFHSVAMVPLNGEGLAVFLAERNVDVWGIDLRNVQIPGEVTDLSFAHDWGIGVQVKDTMFATRLARHVRSLNGQDSMGIILGGHSAGASVAYAVANAEAVLDTTQRDVIGIIPMEMVYKLPPSAASQAQFSCIIQGAYTAMNNAGNILFDNLSWINTAKLGLTHPNDSSPYNPQMTNLQFVLDGTSALSFAPFYRFHKWSVSRDAAGLAIAGRYTSTEDILKVGVTSAVYQVPNSLIADFFGTSCTITDSPYDDYLAQMTLPVLYVGAAGGFGRLGEYTPQLLGSTDVKTIMMQARPDDDAANDFGHMEPLTADEARSIVWEPMHTWIVEHSNKQ